MDLYHGTNINNANEITSGNISTDFGGGELGKGFYIGDLPHEAFSWAWHQYKTDKCVVKLIIEDNDVLNQNPLCLNYEETCVNRNRIRAERTTRTFIFKRNIIWAPVVGKNIPNFSQLKIESKLAENLVNSDAVIKSIV
ncbi:hypothetical protein MCEGE10_01949 [Flavobacteriaceae bacterium]